MASKKRSGVTAMRYATALVDVAQDSKKIDSVQKDMNDLHAMILESQDFQNFLKSPLISKAEKTKVVDSIAAKGKFQDATANFLKVLVQNGRLPILHEIVHGFFEEVSKRNGEMIANVVSAFPLDAQQKKDLEASLAKSMGKTIAVNVDVDKELIGGMVVTVGSQMFDASVKRKLERLKIAMTSGANNNAATDKAANEN